MFTQYKIVSLVFTLSLLTINVSALAQSAKTGSQTSSNQPQKQDSISHLDSLEELRLQKELDGLKNASQKRKEELQLQLDSVREAKSKRDLLIKKQVDSLRANNQGVPVILFSDSVFYMYARVGPFTAADRARRVQERIEKIVENNTYDSASVKIIESEESTDIIHEDQILLSITDRDAFWVELSRAEAAQKYLEAIQQSIYDYQNRNYIWKTLKRVIMLLITIALFFFGVKYLNKGLIWLNAWLIEKMQPYIHGIKLRNYEFLSAEREEKVVRWLLQVLKWLIIGLSVYLALPVLFSIFPATKGIASALIGYVLDPVKAFGVALIGFIPELITIIVIILITRYFVRFLKFLAGEIEEGKFSLPGFYPDWAQPTYNLLRFIIYAFAFVIIWPYLPGSDSTVFQGVSVFFGLLISLGSSSAISNMVAGLVITYMRAFRIGDRVKIGDTTGDVMEKTMLVTRLRTIKNEEVTIPNSAIMSGVTVNYTASAREQGLILHTTITIGYDVPWRQVHELLIGAALKCDHIKPEPKPFVLQTSLDDFYVSYQINAYTDQPGMAAKIYSHLHANIQDAFNEAGVEILSPHYRAARDGNMVTIPADYLPKDYVVPSFRVQQVDKK